MDAVKRIACVLLAVMLAAAWAPAKGENYQFAAASKGKLGRLIYDLLSAYEKPAPEDEQRIADDLDAVKAVNENDYDIAKAIADHWIKVYADPGYQLFLSGNGTEELKRAGVPDSPGHAFVVLGYELSDGEMTRELKGRCDAAAEAARAFPQTILVTTGGATGANNPQRHTEAGMMKMYLAEECGIDPDRIYTDEKAMTTAQNAQNTLKILRENGVHSLTVVTSSYHQRWGQVLFNAAAAMEEKRDGYEMKLIGNYCFDTKPSVFTFYWDARIAASQLAGMLDVLGYMARPLPSAED